MSNGKVRDEEEWEALCQRCGVCCFEKIEDHDGNIFFTQTPCRYLDVATRLCKIYERRREINPECVKLSPGIVHKLYWLHDGCAYKKLASETKSNPVGKKDKP